ncbi:MAG: PTS sugar transporter subunit IIA [Phycisphaerales bacterium]|nr:PTS sugar transporter subunit IIA [Phycisphaerales bacterium]
MPFGNLSIEELSRHIGMDARIVRKWADKGVLPGQLVGGHWRFNRAEMLEWLQQQMHGLDEEHVRNLERAMRSHECDDELAISVRLALEAIELNLAARSRSSVLKELVRVAERTELVYDSGEITAALEQREALGSTALPKGIAFPHPRRPLPYATAEPLVCLGRIPAGLPFGAPDGRLTDLFVLIVAQDERQHLGLLARLGMIFNTSLPDRLRMVESAAEALEAVREAEMAFVAGRR